MAGVSFGTNGLLGLPINGKLAHIKTRRKTRLPFVIGACRANDLDTEIL